MKILTDIKKQADALVANIDALIDKFDGLSSSGGSSRRTARSAAKPARGGKQRSAKKTTKRAAGVKRDPAVLADLQTKLSTYIAANPGQGIEQIGPGVGADTKALILPLRKLKKDKAIRTEGSKRATKYFPVESKAADKAA